MYTHMYKHVYINIHVYIYIYMYIYMYIYLYVYTHTYVCIYTYVYMSIHSVYIYPTYYQCGRCNGDQSGKITDKNGGIWLKTELCAQNATMCIYICTHTYYVQTRKAYPRLWKQIKQYYIQSQTVHLKSTLHAYVYIYEYVYVIFKKIKKST